MVRDCRSLIRPCRCGRQAAIQIGQSGWAYMLEVNTSYLVANSVNAPLLVDGQRVIAQQSSNPLISQTSQAYAPRSSA